MNPGKNRGGIVVPHAVKWPQAFLALTIYVLLRLVGFTLRYRWNVPFYAPVSLERAAEPFAGEEPALHFRHLA